MTLYRTLSLLIGVSLFAVSQPSYGQKHGRTPDTAETDLTMEDNSTVNVHPAPGAVYVPPKPRPQADPSDFSITTSRIDNRKISKNIQLLNPPHKSTYTPGLITFSWKYNTPPKKTPVVVLKIERLDGKKKFSFKTHREKRLLELEPGEYKWKVSLDKPGSQESRWRLFKVIGLKSESVTKLYEGDTPGSPASRNRKLKKPMTVSVTKTIEEDDDDLVEEDDAVAPNRVPSSVPLPAPSWVKKGITALPKK